MRFDDDEGPRTPPILPAQTNSQLLDAWDKEAQQVAVDDVVKDHYDRIRERFNDAWARYIRAIHSNASQDVRDELYKAAIRSAHTSECRSDGGIADVIPLKGAG